MSLIDFIRPMEESQDEFDVELEKFDADSEQEAVNGDTSGGRSWGRLLPVASLLVGTAYVVSRLHSSPDSSFTDIVLADDSVKGDSAADKETGAGDGAADGEDVTVTVEHGPEAETDDAAANDEATEVNETGDASDEETDTDGDGAVEVEIESPGDDEE